MRRSPSPRPRALLAALATITAGQISCAWLDSDAGLPAGADLEPLEVLTTFPAPKALEVDPRTQIDFCLSAAVDPQSVGIFDALLISGRNIFDAEVHLQLFPWLPPGGLGPLGDAPWCPGSVLSLRTQGDLAAGLSYRARLFPRAIGWAGEALDLAAPPWAQLDDGSWAATVEFTVAGDPASDPASDPAGDPDPEDEEAPQDPPLTLRDLYAPGGPFDPARNLCSCHREAAAQAGQRLDLTAPATAFAALVLDRTPASTGYPRVTPSRPSESFLIHKLLRDPSGDPLHAVRGAPMPPDAPLPYADLVAIARWIEDGALP